MLMVVQANVKRKMTIPIVLEQGLDLVQYAQMEKSQLQLSNVMIQTQKMMMDAANSAKKKLTLFATLNTHFVPSVGINIKVLLNNVTTVTISQQTAVLTNASLNRTQTATQISSQTYVQSAATPSSINQKHVTMATP